MHELSITESILRIALRAAEENKVQRVLAIRIKLGAYSGLVPHYIQEYFDLASRGTPAEGARLEIEIIPASVVCRSCGWSGPVERFRLKCGGCGSSDVELRTGREYYVDSLEAE